MFIKGLLGVLLLTLCTVSYSPSLFAEDSAKKVDEVISWWEKYGKYWDKAKKEEKEKKEELSSLDSE